MLKQYKKLTETIFEQSAQCITDSKPIMSEAIAKAAELMVQQLKNNKKILVAGNGGSAADAIHFSAELLNRFETEREPLAMISLNSDVSTLTSISNDYDFSEVFSKQIKALGQEGDIFIGFSTSGNSKNIIKACEIAHQKSMHIIVLTGNEGGAIAKMLDHFENTNLDNIILNVPSTKTARIQEVHGIIIHSLCSVVDQEFTMDT